MSNYCSRHGCNYADGRSCPECRADQAKEDRRDILDNLSELSEARVDVSELADKINNPGDYDCPECSFRALQFLARRCPKCHADINYGYWDAVSERRKAQTEERARLEKERAEKKAQAEREEAKAKAEANARTGKEMGCFLVVVVIALCVAGVVKLIEDSKTESSPTHTKSYTPPARSDYTTPTREAPEQTRTEPPPSVSKEPERFFTLGSTIDEVRLAQGEPSVGFMPGTQSWFYGHDGAAVYFSEGRVWRWTSYPGAPLRARIIPNGPVDETLKYFTVGSTMDEVLFVQGQPFSIGYTSVLTGTLLRTDEEVKSGAPTIKTSWIYGFASEVFFRDGKVTHWTQDDKILCWKSTGPIVLKARILPEKPADSNLTYFTFGSTRDEVLAVQGRPDNPFGVEWEYGKSKVSFTADLVVLGRTRLGDRVTQWKSDPDNPLKARVVPNGPVDETTKSFTVGSTMDEVLFVQGQPDSVKPYAHTDTWTYGPSSVNFERGRVVNWISYPYHGPLKAKPKK